MVEIVSYHERWPTEFTVIATTLRNELGDQALRIDHIGSTSVPVLSAKDIIDIQGQLPRWIQTIASSKTPSATSS